MAVLIKQSDYDKLVSQATEVPTLKDAIEQALSSSDMPFLQSYIVVPDDEYEQAVKDASLPWEEAMSIMEGKKVKR